MVAPWVWPVVGGAVSAIGSIAGGIFGSDAAKDNIKMQREFAQNGIQWRVEDAKKAGIHPLAALGARGAEFQPVNVGDRGWSGAGQALGDAIMRAASDQERRELGRVQLAQERIRLNTMNLEYLGMLEQYKNLKRPSTVPDTSFNSRFGLPGQGSVQEQGSIIQDQEGGVQFIPSQVPYSEKPGIQSGIVPMEQYAIDRYGNLNPILNQTTQEALENDTFLWFKRLVGQMGEYGAGWISGGLKGPQGDKFRAHLRKIRPWAPKGYEFRYNIYRGNFVLRKKVKGYSNLFDHDSKSLQYPY